MPLPLLAPSCCTRAPTPLRPTRSRVWRYGLAANADWRAGVRDESWIIYLVVRTIKTSVLLPALVTACVSCLGMGCPPSVFFFAFRGKSPSTLGLACRHETKPEKELLLRLYLTLSRSRLSTHKRARASEAVRPGDSIPKRWTKPATPCSDGPLSTKSADGSPRPLTCVHTERL